MSFFSLSKTFTLFFILMSYLFLRDGHWLYFLVLTLFTLFYLYFNHIKLMHFRDSLHQITDVYLSPCDGKVLTITEKDGFKKVLIRMSLLNRWALFLPQSSSLELLSQSKGKKHWRNSKSWPDDDSYVINLVLENRASSIYFLKIYPDLIGLSPLLYMKTGDRGRVGANLGRIFLGGTIVIELPDTVNIIVNVNDKVRAGETILAGIQEEI